MNITEAEGFVKERLTTDRYKHTVRVAETAVWLAEKYNVSREKAILAGLLHDLAKCDPVDELKQQILHYNLPKELLQFNEQLWHGPVGAMIAKNELGIKDKEVFNAIYYHTTGREKMSTFELVIFVADYIEPLRNFSGVDEIRKVAEQKLELAAQKILKNTIIHLVKKGVTVFPDTFKAYNELTNLWEGK